MLIYLGDLYESQGNCNQINYKRWIQCTDNFENDIIRFPETEI